MPDIYTLSILSFGLLWFGGLWVGHQRREIKRLEKTVHLLKNDWKYLSDYTFQAPDETQSRMLSDAYARQSAIDKVQLEKERLASLNISAEDQKYLLKNNVNAEQPEYREYKEYSWK
jgi:hypothetical protein